MKQLISSAAALLGGLAASGAMAQSNVTVYGIVDTGLVYTTNANAAGDSVVKMPTLTGTFPSRIGFKGTEDLGGGLQAVFVLEGGFGPDTGAMGQGGRLFGRQSYVGLKSSYGTLMLGRQLNMTYLAMIKTDILGPNLFGLGSIDPYLPNARSDNAVGYLGTFSNWTLGATYSFGRDVSSAGGPAGTACAGEVAADSKACRQLTGMLAYETKPFGVNASYDLMRGNTGAAGGLTSSADTDKRITVNAYFMLGDVKVGAGVVDRATRASTGRSDSDLYYLGASYPLTPFTQLDVQVGQRNIKDSDADARMIAARLTYNLSKRTAVYAMAGHMNNYGASAVALDGGGTVGAGLNQNGVAAGIRHAF
jgi:predicted porin